MLVSYMLKFQHLMFSHYVRYGTITKPLSFLEVHVLKGTHLIKLFMKANDFEKKKIA